MTGESFFELLGGLDGALVDGAESAPAKRRPWLRIPAAIASAAACAAVLVLLFLPRAGSTASDGKDLAGESFDNEAISKDTSGSCAAPGDLTGSGDVSDTPDSGTSSGFYAVITELDGQIVVTPAEDSPLYGKAERIILTMTGRAPAEFPENLQIGETVRIECDLTRLISLDSQTLEIPDVYGIYRERSDR